MAMNWKVFYTRTMSAIVFAIIMLAGLLLEHPAAILVLAILVQFLAIKEFFALSKRIFPKESFSVVHTAIALISSLLLIALMVLREHWYLYILILVPISLFLHTAISTKRYWAAALTTVVAILYIGMPMAMLVDMRQMKILPIAVIVLIWINDTMAYIVGSFIGKRPLSIISPKKTWEGTLGGIILTILAGGLFGYYGNSGIAFYHWMVIACIVAIMGTLGDLLESKLKRIAEVKDSGNILPGHGGALDRFDSLLVALPFVYVYVLLFVSGLVA